MPDPRPAPSSSQRQRTRRELWTPSALRGLASGGRTPAMRRPDRHLLSGGPAALPAPPPAAPSLSVITWNRLAFGPRPGDLPAFVGLGATPLDRLTAWVDQQLDPASIPDTDLENRIAASGFTTLGKGLAQLWLQHVENAPDYATRIQPLEETERATILRMVYSERQLFEVLADFWHNHFNVYGSHSNVAPVFVHYDRDVIRANALGNFRTMLEAVAKSTAMLYYLDNYTSSNAGPNENFSRELFELHTLGAENYLGVLRQNQVPQAGGRPVGYVDDDVYEATRAFTGWSVADGRSGAPDTGLFYYRPDWHDRFQKTVLGVFIPPDQPDLRDGKDVLNALASHPGTGRHIAGKLCRRLVADEPPQSLVDQAAALFTAQWQAPDQIAQVVRFIALSPEFRSTWGGKVKRPLEMVASALRGAGGDIDLAETSSEDGSFLYRLSHTGQFPFDWRAPDGYPDRADAWLSSSSRVGTWRLLNWLTEVDENDGRRWIDAMAQTPGNVRSASALADFWIQRILGRPMEPTDRQEIVELMAQGRHPDYDLPLDTDSEVQARLRTLVGLLFLSPDFQWK